MIVASLDPVIDGLMLACRDSAIPDDVFQEYMADLGAVWTPESYSLFENNCNHFSEEVALFLTGTSIPVNSHPSFPEMPMK